LQFYTASQELSEARAVASDNILSTKLNSFLKDTDRVAQLLLSSGFFIDMGTGRGQTEVQQVSQE
jgi:hypothetical protein